MINVWSMNITHNHLTQLEVASPPLGGFIA